MTTVTTVARIYIPSPGQADAATRASALGAALADTSLATEPRYVARAISLPCVVLDRGHEIVVVSDNPQTTHAAVDAAQDAMLADDIPATISRASDVTSTVASHSAAANPHGITPAAIGAAASSHSHSYEASGAVATHAAASDPHPTYLTQAEGDALYSVTAHTHAAANDARLITFASTADQAVTGTALVNVTNVAFAVAASSTYIFSVWVDVTASGGTSPLHNYSFTGPGGITRFMAKRTQMTAATAQTTSTVTALATGFGAGATVAGIKNIFEGVIVTGATAGTVQLAVTPGGTIPTSTIGRGSGGYAMKVA